MMQGVALQLPQTVLRPHVQQASLGNRVLIFKFEAEYFICQILSRIYAHNRHKFTRSVL